MSSACVNERVGDHVGGDKIFSGDADSIDRVLSLFVFIIVVWG